MIAFSLRLFVRIARRDSFSAAGRELGIPQLTASRSIAALEREIGTALLVRDTRAVTLTDKDADFLARLEPILAELDEAEQAARGTEEDTILTSKVIFGGYNRSVQRRTTWIRHAVV